MKLKDRIEKIKQLIDKRDLEAINKELDYWDNEIEQMFSDRENKIITIGLCAGCLVIGFVLAFLFI
jgi:hypothetical protein